jgi:DNA polymerase IIIc chi subunit
VKYNLTTFRKLIIEAFSDEELQLFVSDYFVEVFQSFSIGTSLQMKAQQLVTYCERREQLAMLEEHLKIERPEKYEKYKDQLKTEDGKEFQSILDEMRAKESELSDVLEAVNLKESSQQPEFSRSLHVFLCHSSSDKPAVRKLYHQLRADGFEPWLDEENLLPGQNWKLEISKAVRSAHVVIVCCSGKSVSKTGYIQKEIRHALDVADEQPEDAIFLIPLRLEQCEIPERLRRWQWVNLFEETGYERLIRALRERAKSME